MEINMETNMGINMETNMEINMQVNMETGNHGGYSVIISRAQGPLTGSYLAAVAGPADGDQVQLRGQHARQLGRAGEPGRFLWLQGRSDQAQPLVRALHLPGMSHECTRDHFHIFRGFNLSPGAAEVLN